MGVLKLFGLFFAINLFTIGGGFVMLPILHGYFVDQYGLLTNREFLEAVALGQVTPGPLTVMNAFVGYKISGISGAAAATLGTYMPSLIVATLVSKYYLKFKGSRIVDSAFMGIKPAVVGMLLAVAVTLGRESFVSWPAAALGAASFGLMAFTKVDPTFVILGAGVAGYLIL
jgi:chromate transporter